MHVYMYHAELLRVQFLLLQGEPQDLVHVLEELGELFILRVGLLSQGHGYSSNEEEHVLGVILQLKDEVRECLVVADLCLCHGHVHHNVFILLVALALLNLVLFLILNSGSSFALCTLLLLT